MQDLDFGILGCKTSVQDLMQDFRRDLQVHLCVYDLDF